MTGKVVQLKAVAPEADEEVVSLLSELLLDALDGRITSLLVVADHPADEEGYILTAGVEGRRTEILGKLAKLTHELLRES